MGAAARCKHSRAGEGGAAHGLVDDVPPTREIGPEHPVETGLLGGLELGPAGGYGHRRLQRVAERAVVEVDLRGHLVEKHDPVRLVLRRGSRCPVDFQGGAAATCIDPAVEVGGYRASLFPVNQASMHGAVEDFVDGAEVLANLVRLADYVVQKAQVCIGITDEVVHRHVARLTVAIEPAVALLQARRVPGAVVVQQVAGGAMQVEALGGGVGGDEDAHLRGRVVERRLDVLATRLVHALRSAGSEEREHAIGRVAVTQAPGEVVEGGLVLREDDQAFVVAKFAVRAEQALDQSDEGIEAGVGQRCLIRDRHAVQREPKGIKRAFDAADLATHVVGEVPEPRAHDGRSGGFALLGFPIVPGLLAHGAFGRRKLRLGRGIDILVQEPLPRPAPRLGERGRTGQQPLAENFHCEGSGAASGPGS